MPEEILLGEYGYDVLATSNQAPPGQLLMSDDQLDQLYDNLTVVHEKFEELYSPAPGERFAMEIEFKITSDDILAVKQARPWVFSEAMAAVEPKPNSPATGQPTIEGTAQVGETLTVDTSAIDDDDGLDNVGYGYQWLADDTEIAGATDPTYTPVDDDAGLTIKVKVAFFDDRSNPETLTSAVTAAVIAAVTPLTAEFRDAPDKHLGTGVFTFEIAFSEPISIGYATLRDDSLEVTNGSATRARRVNGQSDLWEITVEPDSDAAVTVVLPITGDCAAQDAVCTRDGTKLSNRSDLTVPGPAAANSPATGAPTISGTAQVGETLTVDTSGIDDEDGIGNATFSYQWIAGTTDISGATRSSYAPSVADLGKTIKVRVSFMDGASNVETLTSEATATVIAAVTPLTAGFQDAPDKHLGTGAFTFGIAFSEPISISYKTLRDDSLEVTNGSATKAKRVDGQSDLWEITVDPDSGAAVTVVLPITEDCSTQGAVCSRAGGNKRRPLSNRSELTVPGPAAANSPATGAPIISGTVQVGQTLTASTTGIADADGLTNVSFSYQWLAGDVDINGATGGSYTLVADDEGKAIKVRVSFTDDDDNGETLTSVATVAVSAAANSPATGAPTITGTPQVGETLTAGTSDIEDTDGLTNVSFSYQWLTDDADIAGATGGSYTLVADDEGKTIKVRVSFTDDRNHQETLTSEATAAVAVAAKPNSPATGQPTISGTAQVGQTLTASTSGIADADGLTNVSFSYQWIANDGSTDTDISNATGDTYTLVDDDEGKTIKVRVSFTDDENHQETGTSAATAAVEPRPNSPATGAPTISGTVQVGQTLTADTSGIADADGLTNVSFSYQWIGNDVEITGATGSTYTLVAADEGKTIKVRVSFTDDDDNEETLTSVATAAVEAAEESSSIWSATLTAGESSGFVGFWKGVCGALDPDEFSLDGSDYTVMSLSRYGDLMFAFVLDQALPGDFTLQVGETTFRSEEAEVTTSPSSYSYQWQNKIPDLSDGDIVEVSLTLAE